MSSPTATTDSFLNGPLINSVTDYIAQLQGRNIFTKERFKSLRQHFLIAVGCLVVFYFLIYIQILFFWILKLIFRFIFKLISIIFWLPLKTVRFFKPKIIDYDILFPLFWLCSILSFYISKISHDNICRFYDQHLVQRFPVLRYDQTKRDEIRKYLFAGTFVVILLLQTLFILVPIGLSVRRHNDQSHITSTPMSTTLKTTVTTTTTKSVVNNVVKTMSTNLYDRFIEAFKDNNETQINEKSEDTFKTAQKSIKNRIEDLKPTNTEQQIHDMKRSSRFQRWIVHYLKAPFQKWEGKKIEEIKSNIEQKNFNIETEEEKREPISSSIESDLEETDDEEDVEHDSSDDDEQEEQSTITERTKQDFDKVQHLGEKISSFDDEDGDEGEESPSLKQSLTDSIETAKKLSIKESIESDESDEEFDTEKAETERKEEDDEDDDEKLTTMEIIKDQIVKPFKTVKNIAAAVGKHIKNQFSSSDDQVAEDSGYESDEEEQSTRLTETKNTNEMISESDDEELILSTDQIIEHLSKPMQSMKDAAGSIKNKIVSSDDEEDEDEQEKESLSRTEQIKKRLSQPIEATKDTTPTIKNKIVSAEEDQYVDKDDDDSDDDSEEEEEEETPTRTEQIKRRLSQPIEAIKDAAAAVKNKILPAEEVEKEDEEEEEEEESPSRIEQIKKRLSQPIEAIKDAASTIKNKIVPTEEPPSTAEQIKKRLSQPIESIKDAAAAMKNKIVPAEEPLSTTEQIKKRLSNPIEAIKDATAAIKNNIISSEEQEPPSRPFETIKDAVESIKNKIVPPEEPPSAAEQIKEGLSKSFESIKDAAAAVKNKIVPPEEPPSTAEQIKDGLSKSIESIKDAAAAVKHKIVPPEEPPSRTEQIKDGLSKSIESIKDAAAVVKNKIVPAEEPPSTAEQIKRRLSAPIEAIKDAAAAIKNKIVPAEEPSSRTEQIKEYLFKPIEAAKSLDEQIVTNVKDKFSTDRREEEIGIESDEEGESMYVGVIENVLEPIKTVAKNLQDKLPTLTKTEEDLTTIERTKGKASKTMKSIKTKTSSKASRSKSRTSNVIESNKDSASDVVEKSSEYIKDRTAHIQNSQSKKDKTLSKVKHKVREPFDGKFSKSKKHQKEKSLTEKAKEKLKSNSKTSEEKLSRHPKKKKNLNKNEKTELTIVEKLNGYFDDVWNIWHLTTENIGNIFFPSTKHARHLPRYNVTSVYTAYTDLNCYDYRKKLNQYRLLKRQHVHFIDTYRRHSPFPVYLSILKSNGPKCYRHYPNSSCGILLKSTSRNYKTQLYKFFRFWTIIGIVITILAAIYKAFYQKQTNTSSFRHQGDFDRSSNKKPEITSVKRNDLLKPITTQKSETQQQPQHRQQTTISSNSNTRRLNEQIENQLRRWLQHEQNDGFRNLSEKYRRSMNDTFSKQLERLSVETLQFANAKIHNVSQINNNNNQNDDKNAEKIIITATLDIDHLILNIINTFKEQHFSVETQKLSGYLNVLLIVNPNHYSIEANLRQLKMHPVNIIDPNDILSSNEKQSIVKLLDETINRTVVRYSFRLSDIQEETNNIALQNFSLTTHSDTNKISLPSNKPSTPSLQIGVAHSQNSPSNRYQQTVSTPTVVINDTNQRLHTNQTELNREPKKLLVRLVKAVKLHDVEQPYCIIELNHPKQVQQTSIAKNGLNPFWDERFIFECDEKSNQIHLQIIDHKKASKKSGKSYVDNVYADVSIPFSYITSTVYKQDVQISPQYPESIIRVEFSTLSEEEALAANNGYDIESINDSQTWTYSDRETAKIEHDYPQRYQQTLTNDYLSSSYDSGASPKQYDLTNLYNDERSYSSTLPHSLDLHTPTIPLTPRDGGAPGNDKPQKSKSFMSSLKHLTLPRRKHHSKDKNEQSISSQASSVSQLNTSFQLPETNPVTHSISSALPGPHSDYLSTQLSEPVPTMRRSRSISQSFRNLFRSSSKKKLNAAKTDALGEYENSTHNFINDNRNYLSTSTPTAKKLPFFHRRKSKQKSKQQTNCSTNSLSSYDCSSIASVESVRDTPVRANVGHPVTMTRSFAQ